MFYELCFVCCYVLCVLEVMLCFVLCVVQIMFCVFMCYVLGVMFCLLLCVMCCRGNVMCCAGLLLIIRGRPSNKTERGSSRSCCIVSNFLALRKGFCNWADLNFLHKQQHHYIL